MAQIKVEVDLDEFSDHEILYEAVYRLRNGRGSDLVRKALEGAINDITGSEVKKERNLLDALKMEICEKNLGRRTLDEIEEFFKEGG